MSDTFLYDPAGGDLLMDVYMRNAPLTEFLDASAQGQQSAFTRVVSDPGGVDALAGFVGTSLGANTPYGIVTQFGLVPEASTVLHFALGLGAIWARRCRRLAVQSNRISS